MFRRLSIFLYVLFTTLLLTACSNPSQKFDSFLDTLFIESLSSDALTLHYTLTDTQEVPDSSQSSGFGHLSTDYLPQNIAALENISTALDSFSTTPLSETQRMNLEILQSYFDLNRQLYDYYLYEEILSPLNGAQVELPILLSEFRIANTEDAELYLQLLSTFPEYIDEIISFEIEKSSAGLFMPDYALDTVLEQCDSFLQADSTHFLYRSFEEKIQSLSISEQEKLDLIKRNDTLLREHFFPCYATLKDALQALSGSGINANGLCYFPSGRSYYELLTTYSTGSSKSVSQLESTIQQQRSTDLSALSVLILKHPDYLESANHISLPFDTPEAMIRQLQSAMATDFSIDQLCPYTIKHADASLCEYIAPAFYLTAPVDDESSHVIYLNDASVTSDIELFTTLAHEGYPGHLYETVTTHRADIPRIRFLLNFSGYTEGWATYVEMLSYSYAGLEPDLASMLMYNRSILLSLYASMDLGIHYDGWTLEETIAFLTAYGITDSVAIKDIYQSIVVNPCGYTKYYVGYLEFLELKENAREQFPDTFSNKAFHHAVLSIGPASFELLSKYLPYYMN